MGLGFTAWTKSARRADCGHRASSVRSQRLRGRPANAASRLMFLKGRIFGVNDLGENHPNCRLNKDALVQREGRRTQESGSRELLGPWNAEPRESNSGLWGDTRITPPKPAGPSPHGDESRSGLTIPLGGRRRTTGRTTGWIMLSDLIGQASLSGQHPGRQVSQPSAWIQIGMREFLVSAIRSRTDEQSTGWNRLSRGFTESETPCRKQPDTIHIDSRFLAAERALRDFSPLNTDPSRPASRRASTVPPAARSSIRGRLDPEARHTGAHGNGF